MAKQRRLGGGSIFRCKKLSKDLGGEEEGEWEVVIKVLLRRDATWKSVKGSAHDSKDVRICGTSLSLSGRERLRSEAKINVQGGNEEKHFFRGKGKKRRTRRRQRTNGV